MRVRARSAALLLTFASGGCQARAARCARALIRRCAPPSPAAQEKGWFFGGAASGALVAGGSTSGSNAGRAFPSFGTRPVVILFLQRQVPQAHPVLSCKLLHRAEAALELGVRPPQRAAAIDLRVPRQVGTDEQAVAQLDLQPRPPPRALGRVGPGGAPGRTAETRGR